MIASLDFGDLNITSQEDDILDEDEALAGKYKFITLILVSTIYV